jgi:hypothetical protein
MARTHHAILLARDMLGFSLISHTMVVMTRCMGFRMVFSTMFMITRMVMAKDMRVFPHVDGRRMTMVFPIIKALQRLTLRDFRHIIHSLILLSMMSSCLASVNDWCVQDTTFL